MEEVIRDPSSTVLPIGILGALILDIVTMANVERDKQELKNIK